MLPMLPGSARRPFLLGRPVDSVCRPGASSGPTAAPMLSWWSASVGRPGLPPGGLRGVARSGPRYAPRQLGSQLGKRSPVTLNTIALELVPPNVDGGLEKAAEDAQKVVRYSAESGLAGRIRHVMIPGMIA